MYKTRPIWACNVRHLMSENFNMSTISISFGGERSYRIQTQFGEGLHY